MAPCGVWSSEWGGSRLDPIALITIKKLALGVLAAGLVVWVLLSVLLRKPRY